MYPSYSLNRKKVLRAVVHLKVRSGVHEENLMQNAIKTFYSLKTLLPVEDAHALLLTTTSSRIAHAIPHHIHGF